MSSSIIMFIRPIYVFFNSVWFIFIFFIIKMLFWVFPIFDLVILFNQFTCFFFLKTLLFYIYTLIMDNISYSTYYAGLEGTTCFHHAYSIDKFYNHVSSCIHLLKTVLIIFMFNSLTDVCSIFISYHLF